MRDKFVHGISDYKEWRKQIPDNNETAKKLAIIADVENELAKTGVMTLEMEKRLLSCLHFTTLNGKLDGFYSISTSVLLNSHCQKYARIHGSICEKCYAANSVNNYDGLAQALEINYYILNNYLISQTAWNTLQFPSDNGYGRIESHGDCDSTNCTMNYNRMCKGTLNKDIHFAAWSKNNYLWIHAFELEGKAKNLNFITSALFIGEKRILSDLEKKYVDHVFTVYNDSMTDINCGARDCGTCLNCYDPNVKNRPFYISEQLKGVAKTNYPVLIGKVNWSRENNVITLVFHDMTNDRHTTKHYKTERGAKAAETRFYNMLARNNG